MKGAQDAVLTLKLAINIEKSTRNTPEGLTDVLVPKFKHDISFVMQVKDKASGELVGDYQLVWDEDDGKYVIRKIDDGQTSMFDQDDEPIGKFVDADYKVVDEEAPAASDFPALPEGQKALPEAGEGTDEPSAEEPETPGEAQETSEDNSDGAVPDDGHYDEETPFGWLVSFIGDEMYVDENMGNYAVRTVDRGRCVLSSATSPDQVFYCDKEKLAPHVGHRLMCAGYGEPWIIEVSIECPECGETLFSLRDPGFPANDQNDNPAEPEPGVDQPDEADGENTEPSSELPDGYEYYIRFTYNLRGDYWKFSLYDSLNEPIVLGIKIVPRFPLNVFCGVTKLPDGGFVARTKLDRIGRNDFVDGKAQFIFCPVALE